MHFNSRQSKVIFAVSLRHPAKSSTAQLARRVTPVHRAIAASHETKDVQFRSILSLILVTVVVTEITDTFIIDYFDK